jgi:hypothetical protein
MGSWTIYGLGSESDSLPAYVVLPDPKGALEAGQPMYSNGFLPAVYQPTMMRPGSRPVLNLDLPGHISLDRRRKTIDLIRNLNAANLAHDDGEFSARMNAYDLAFRMQTEAPAVFDISRETETTREMYGIGKEKTDDYGRRCLLARRLVEKGVRFVCVVSGGGPGNMQWDAHDDIEENHLRMAAQTDQPRRTDQRPEAARNARRDARAVGRRIRAFSRSAGRKGPGSPQPRVYDVDGRRRRQRRADRRRN